MTQKQIKNFLRKLDALRKELDDVVLLGDFSCTAEVHCYLKAYGFLTATRYEVDRALNYAGEDPAVVLQRIKEATPAITPEQVEELVEISGISSDCSTCSYNNKQSLGCIECYGTEELPNWTPKTKEETPNEI